MFTQDTQDLLVLGKKCNKINSLFTQNLLPPI